MKESIVDMLDKVSDRLDQFGEHDESSAIAITSRLLRTVGVTSLDQYEAFVEKQRDLKFAEERDKRMES
jgi:hypothetical protein